jgi:hypothetical protein
VIRPLRRLHLATMVLLALMLPAIVTLAVLLREPPASQHPRVAAEAP